MANWEETINIAGIHRLYTNGGINLQQVAKAVVRKLQNTEAFATSDPELMDIIMNFGAIDEFARLKDYQVTLDLLYEFGDKENRLWVEAEGVSPQEHDEISAKTRNPYEDDTKPEISVPRYHGPLKGPYATTWADVGLEKKKPEEWVVSKPYSVGDIVIKGSLQYQCLISCANVDPAPNSYKTSDAWKWLGQVDKNPSDPRMVLRDRLTCEPPTKGRVYPLTRKYHHMSEDDFNKKLTASFIIPATVPKDLYSYMKDCEEIYQDWLILRFNNGNMTFRPLAVFN